MKKQPAIIIGGGPAGSTTALHLLQAGIRPLIVERQTFPRYHIGESLTGECRNSLQKLGLESAILAQNYPDKRGVNVFNPNGVPFWVEVKGRCPDTQALIPNATWSVARSSFDSVLLDAARERGAEYMQCEAVAPLRKGNRVTGLQIRSASGQSDELSCEVLVDCSGQGTFLANRGVTGPKIKGSYTHQVAIFSQLHGVTRDSGPTPATAPGNTLIFYKQKHHWAWMIPITDSKTSVGVVVPASYFKTRRLDKAEFLRSELLSLNPNLSRRITNTSFLEEVRTNMSYSYSVSDYSGPGFLCVGDSHEFTDPIFSFGVFLSIREGEFAAEAIQSYLGKKTSGKGNPFVSYEKVNAEGQDAVRDLIDCFWEYPLVFTRMVDGARRDDITDLFAGRLYGQMGQDNQARQAMGKLMTTRRAQFAAPNSQRSSQILEEIASALA